MKFNTEEIKSNIMSSADNMASAATSFDKGGYDVFLSARENFKTTLEEALKEINNTEETTIN